MRKDKRFEIRCSIEEETAYERAADAHGQKARAWARDVLNRAAGLTALEGKERTPKKTRLGEMGRLKGFWSASGKGVKK